MNNHLLVFVLLISGIQHCYSQNVGVSSIGSTPDASAVLDIDATDRGLLMPRLTAAQRDNIASPAAGLFLYNTTANKLEYWNGTAWMQLANSLITSANPTGTSTGTSVSVSNSGMSADPSAILDIQSTTGGLLIPRMNTTERNAIASPVVGLIIYNATTRLLNFYSSAGWKQLCGTSVSTATGSVITSSNAGINTNAPDPSSMLDVYSVKGGIALPRMSTAQRSAILSPAQGLMVYNITTQSINIYDGVAKWLDFTVQVIPSAPLAATNTATANQIVWNWTTVSDATGYKYNVSNDYSNATDAGINTTYAQSALSCNTADTLYVWAYNCLGVSPPAVLYASTTACPAGNACSWNNSHTFVDSRDGRIYTQVQIGTQCWMAENLDYGVYTPLPTAPGIYQSAGTKYCSNLACNADDPTCPYGGLYQWSNLMNGSEGCNGVCTNGSCTGPGDHQPCTVPVQGLCPAGWHVPSHYEWTQLESAVGGGGPYDETSVSYFGPATTGNALKTIGTGAPPLWSAGNGTNTSGFSAMPAGLAAQRFWNGGAYETAMWTSSNNTSTNLGCGLPVDNCAWYHFIYSNINGVARYIINKQGAGYSVRCVKD